MADSSDEQLNRLIAAYNTWGKEEAPKGAEGDLAENPSMEISQFEERLGKLRAGHSKKQKEAGGRPDGEVRETVRADYLQPAMPRNAYDPVVRAKEKTAGELLKPLSLQEQIEQLKFEETLEAQQHFEVGFGEAAAKNRALQTQIRNERNTKNTLLDDLETQNGEIKGLKLQLELKEAEHFDARQKLAGLKTDLGAADELVAQCTAKVAGLEATLAKCAKIFKREFPDAESLDALTAPESNWKGRAEKLKQLETKLAQLQTERVQPLKKKTDSDAPGSISSKK